MEAFKRFPEEYTRNFKISFSFLNMTNIKFFETDKTWWQKNWRFLFIIPLLSAQFVTMCIYIIKLLSHVQIYEMTYLLPPFLIAVHGTIKAAVIVPKRDNITNIILGLGEMWRAENLTQIQEKEKSDLLKKLNICNSVSYWISVFGSSQYLLTPIIETVIRRLVLQQDCDLLLPLSGAYPFEPSSHWIVYISVYLFQLWAMYFWVFIYVSSEWIMITICALLGSQFVILCGDFANIKPLSNAEMKENSDDINGNGEITIKDFVRRHQTLIKLSQDLDDVFNPMIFTDLLFVGITTCFFRYAGQFSRGPTYMINNYTAVFSSLLQVLYLCYYGELLSGASLNIADKAYDNLWYEGGNAYRKTIAFIIRRSQKPCSLSSLRYSRVTLNMFTTTFPSFQEIAIFVPTLKKKISNTDSLTDCTEKKIHCANMVISTTWSYFSLMSNVYGE